MTNQPSPIDHAAWNTWRRENPFTWPDLHDANLSGADLYRANLRGANLRGANLVTANLVTANLVTANLCGANLCGANLCGANLSGASLCGADLTNADLSNANLYRADLSGANLSGARINWDSHDLISAILSRAAGEDYDRRALAGSILVSRDWCWPNWISLALWAHRPDLLAWARESLAPYVRREDMTAKAYAFVTGGQEVAL